jgi:filamentous hemagglutinin family protein
MNTFKNSQLVFPDLFKPSVKANPKPPPRRCRLVFGTPRKPGNALVFLVSFMTYLLGIFPSMLYALPSDPTVQAGSATVNQPSQDTLVIQQSTDKAIIDWRTFGIDNHEQVNFQLPTSSGVTLNRVTGNERSDILGSLTSNGNLMLINPNGILFGAGSRIDVHGLVATTSNISNENFMSGNYNFNIPSDRGGIVVNRGRITAAQGGLVALVAPGVRNEGILEARLGRVSLASGNTFTLDLYGDQLVNLGLNGEIAEQVTGLDGEVLSSLVSNSGAIYADGGRVRLNVNAARDVVDQVINMSGIIQARTAVEQNGSIVLMGGDEGSVDVSGTLDASGLNEGETGGTIHVFGDRINLFGSALLDASGHNGGGEILVGGDYQGQGDFPTASEVFVDREVSIYNDALWSGDGGRSIFWANRRMRFFGSVYARGGRERGNGGFIEVSGKEELFFDGWADTSAENGLMGTLLLDPEDIIIANGSGASSASGTATFTISEHTLEALSGETNIDLLATNSITMNDLTEDVLDSDGDKVGETSNGVLNLNISGSLTMTAGVGGITFLDTNDKIRSNRAINLTATGGNLTLGSLESSEGNITLQGNDLILAGTISSANGTTTLLSSGAGTIGLGTGTGTFSVSGTELQNITAANLEIGDGTTGSITVGGISAANSNNIAETTTLYATKSSSKVIFAGDSTFNSLTANAGNGIAVNAAVTTDTGNLVLNGGTGGITGTGATTLTSSQGLTLNSAFSSTGDANITAGTEITLANGIGVSSDGTLSLSAAGGVNALGSVTLSSANGFTLNSDFTSASGASIIADSNFDGTGTFTIASGKTATAQSLTVKAADVELNGSINTNNGTTELRSSTGATIGLGDATGTAMTIDGAELQNITADLLVVGGGSSQSDITVDNVTEANSNNVGRVLLLANLSGSSSRVVTFANNTSTFNALTVSADQIIAVNSGITTDAGNLELDGDTGGITGTGITNLTSSQGIILDSSFSSTGDANLNAGTGITLANGVNISSGGTLSLSAGSNINAEGAATVNAASGINLNNDFTSAGAATFDADSDNNGAGSFTVASGGTVATGNNSLSVTGANIVLTGTGALNSGTGTTTLLASNGGTIGLGNVTGKDLTVDNAELGRITASNLVVGDATNGDITVDGFTAANITGTTTLNATKSTSNVTFANNASTFNALTVNAGGTVTDTPTGNLTVNGASSFTGTQGISLTNTANSFTGAVSLNTGGNSALSTNSPLTLASSTVGGTQVVTVGGAGNGLIVSGNQTVGGTTSLTADKDITLTGGLFTSSASATAVNLTSTNGGIFDGDLTGALDIDAANGGLVANSVTGFGTPGNAIETKVASVDIDSTGTGEINIFETDSLNVVNLNHSGTGDINVSYFGTLTNEVNAIAANGTKTFTNRDSGSLFLPEFGKTLSEVSTEKTVSITNGLESNYFFGNQPSPTQGNTVAEMLSGPETGPFVTNVFDENFELIKVAKRSRRAHSGLRGFSNFWGPLGVPNTELVKRPSRKSLREEAKLKKKRSKKRRSGIKRKARSRLKNARVKPVGDTASLPKVQKPRQKQKRSPKPTKSWLGTQFGNFFK